jgi:hypothetical protein
MPARSPNRSTVLVVRAWMEEGRPDGFRARLIQAGPGSSPAAQVVTTSLEDTVRAVRAWLTALDQEHGPVPEPRHGPPTS